MYDGKTAGERDLEAAQLTGVELDNAVGKAVKDMQEEGYATKMAA